MLSRKIAALLCAFVLLGAGLSVRAENTQPEGEQSGADLNAAGGNPADLPSLGSSDVDAHGAEGQVQPGDFSGGDQAPSEPENGGFEARLSRSIILIKTARLYQGQRQQALRTSLSYYYAPEHRLPPSEPEPFPATVDDKSFYPRFIDNHLLDAAAAGDMKAMQFWLNRGADINTVRRQGFDTPLSLAVANVDEGGPPDQVERQIAAVEFLLNRGAKIKTYYTRNHPLLIAARDANSRTMRLLLDSGAGNIDVGKGSYQEHGYTPLMYVVANGDLETARLLLERGADPNVRSNNGVPALMVTSDPQMIDLLLKKGADVNAQDNGGYTALMNQIPVGGEKAIYGDIGAVKFLLAHGANPSLKNNYGQTALEMARSLGEDEIAQRLEQSLSKRP